MKTGDFSRYLNDAMEQSISIRQQILSDADMTETMMNIAMICIKCFEAGNKILFCGNGGSAADAQHLAAELSGRFGYDRPPLPAEALHVNTSYLTAVANDYSFDDVYSRMIDAFGKKGDVLIALSTSGKSPNILNALVAARNAEMIRIGFTGQDQNPMDELCGHVIHVPSGNTARIQEIHISLGHVLCQIIEDSLFRKL